jgi:lipopolysaccharide assembly protein A
MRWVYLIIVVLFAAAVVLFAAQNLGTVTMSFLGFSVRAPLAVLTAVIYILGAVTGGSLYAVLRKSVRGSRSLPVG